MSWVEAAVRRYGSTIVATAYRQFFQTCPTEEKLYALRRELTWSHHRLLMRVEDAGARRYYIDEAAGQGWSTRVLERNIASRAYERLLAPPAAKKAAQADTRSAASRLNPDPALPGEFIKDPYVLEFLGLPESHAGNEVRFQVSSGAAERG